MNSDDLAIQDMRRRMAIAHFKDMKRLLDEILGEFWWLDIGKFIRLDVQVVRMAGTEHEWFDGLEFVGETFDFVVSQAFKYVNGEEEFETYDEAYLKWREENSVEEDGVIF